MMNKDEHIATIDDMTWSYSRIKTFYDCKYKWYLKYIKLIVGEELFFSSYGLFMHNILERYYKGDITRADALDIYLLEYMDRIAHPAPNLSVSRNYFEDGYNYIKNMQDIKYPAIMIEKKVDFCIDSYKFTGYVDYVGECGDGVAIVDHKSRFLKPRSKGQRITRSDIELDSYLSQLYTYSIPVSEELGRNVKSLCFNCFRKNVFIDEPFIDHGLQRSKEWLVSSILKIKSEETFKPSPEYFKCSYLCDVHKECEYFQYL